MRPYLTTLNCGLGRDSIAMLCLLAERRLMVDGALVGPKPGHPHAMTRE